MLNCEHIHDGINDFNNSYISYKLFSTTLNVDGNRFDKYIINLQFQNKKGTLVCPAVFQLGKWPKYIFKTFLEVTDLNSFTFRPSESPLEIDLSDLLASSGRKIDTIHDSELIADGTTYFYPTVSSSRDRNYLWPAGSLVLAGDNNSLFMLVKPNNGFFKYNNEYQFTTINAHGNISAAICTTKGQEKFKTFDLIGGYVFSLKSLKFGDLKDLLYNIRPQLESPHVATVVKPLIQKISIIVHRFNILSFTNPEILIKMSFRALDYVPNNRITVFYDDYFDGNQSVDLNLNNGSAIFQQQMHIIGNSFLYPFEDYHTTIWLENQGVRFVPNEKSNVVTLDFPSSLFFEAHDTTTSSQIQVHFQTPWWETTLYFFFLVILLVVTFFADKKITFLKGNQLTSATPIATLITIIELTTILIGSRIWSVGAIIYYLLGVYLLYKFLKKYCKLQNK